MLLKDICTNDVVVCGREELLSEVARRLRSKHAGDVIVVDDPQGDCLPAGLITDRDIVVKVLGSGLDVNQVTAAQVMSVPVVTASEDEDSAKAVERMRAHGVRRLPVTGRGGRLVGIVTLDDLLRLVAADVGALLDIVAKQQDHERRTLR